MHQWGPSGSKVDVDKIFFCFTKFPKKIELFFYLCSQNFDLKFETQVD